MLHCCQTLNFSCSKSRVAGHQEWNQYYKISKPKHKVIEFCIKEYFNWTKLHTNWFSLGCFAAAWILLCYVLRTFRWFFRFWFFNFSDCTETFIKWLFVRKLWLYSKTFYIWTQKVRRLTSWDGWNRLFWTAHPWITWFNTL